MTKDNESMELRLAQWTNCLEEYRLPGWDELPQLDLYMDQVIILLTRYLGPMVPAGDDREDKPITASIINNYVRMKIMPPPIKKKYNRVHLAYLVVICTLKQSLSISCIQRMLPGDWTEDAAKAMYTRFVACFHGASQVFLTRIQADDQAAQQESGQNIVTALAVLTNLSKGLTEYLLHEDTNTED